MKKLLFILFFITSFLQAQDNSLFWEISGNGLAKNSYLYGTMHVSEKVSFHLSDLFFKNLLASDIVANESNPETWSDLNDLMKNNYDNTYLNYKNNSQYSDFYLFPTDKETIKTIFVNDNSFFRNMLSGVEGDQADFQENTVLDMFIYQTGRKYKKRITGLEDAKESMLSLLQIMDDGAKPKEENRLLLMKIVKNRNPTEVMKEFYREKDIVMLDSIYKLMFSKQAHDLLIVNRNKIMTKSIDSIAKTGSLFSAVGAAHLAGKEGIIELLRQKGYTVKPLIDVFTEKGKNQKKDIEAYFPYPNFVTASTSDGMVTLPLYKKTIEENQNVGSPDFTNGGAINIKRIPLNQFLKKDNEVYKATSLDSLFFEKIAGDIIQKKYFEQENFSGYDIKNITKTGNNQRSRFYITPLEIISISMTGPTNYVRQYESEVFENIKIKSFKTNWEKIKPKKGGFEIELPAFNFVSGNTPEKPNDIEMQAYDHQEKGYYFLTEKTVNDTNILENSEYEHKQIHYQFYLQHDIDSTQTKLDKDKNSYASASKLGQKEINLKSYIVGNKYYLLGSINASGANSQRFFNSFSAAPYLYQSKTRILTDSLAGFSIEIPEKQNEKLFLNIKKDKITSKNTFEDSSKFYSFDSESKKTVDMQYYKYSKYESTVSNDTVYARFKKTFLNFRDNREEDFDDEEFNEDYSENQGNTTSLLNSALYSKKGFSKSSWNKNLQDKNNDYEFVKETTSFDKDKNIYTYDALVSRPNTSQSVKYKMIYHDNSYYLLSSLVEKNNPDKDTFIEKTYQTLRLKETQKKELTEDKVSLFIEDAKSEKDTIRYSALKSVGALKIEKKDLDQVTNFLNTFNFKDNETDAISTLLEKVGSIEDPKVIPFLDRFYKNENTKTTVRISILKALSKQKSKNGYKKINELLDFDLPLPDNQYEITGLFYTFQNDATNSKDLFPDIFQYYSITEYNKPILDFTNDLLEKNLIPAKKLNAFKKIILTNAKLEYKRVLSWNQKKKIDSEDGEDSIEMYNDYEVTNSLENIINYIDLLSNFGNNDSTTKELFDKIKKLDILELNVELMRLGIIQNTVSQEEIKASLDNPKTRFLTINLLLNAGKRELILFSDDEIAESAVLNFINPAQKDSIQLLHKKIVENNGKQITYYFYQISKKDKDSEITKKQLSAIAFINQNNRINPLAYAALSLKEMVEDESLEDEYQLIINQSLNDHHPRASFVKVKNNKENNIDFGF
ncbi:TraB/GumN family protein [Flavobacterium geliluteum]|uniref:TraB/GumN family protein n=1 Tax=Flavobacterium geliluteum TaxID=2816120 RepID=A0A941AXF7_9FLAO|nr:TraB/GumN family protein [Flavobacterium geliluteum]MBP4136512.1 TraB/GumN family protein [Flavobacterium geliluteum]